MKLMATGYYVYTIGHWCYYDDTTFITYIETDVFSMEACHESYKLANITSMIWFMVDTVHLYLYGI